MKKNWYAVYAKPRCEKKVSALLTKKKIENYCPMNRVNPNGVDDRRKPVIEPLIQQFVFVCINEMEMQAIRQMNDVINFVYWLGRPAIIKDVEIESIQQCMGEYDQVTIEKTAVNAWDMVRITTTPGYENEGNIFTMQSNKVKVTLPSLGYALTAEAEKASLNLVNYSYKLRNKVS